MELWAHRGGGVGPLENTLEGFKLAIENGFKAVELDLMITADGHLVVHHDKCLGRLSHLLTNQAFRHNNILTNLTLAQLSSFTFNNAPVLLFIQLLNYLLKLEIQVNVELKAYSPSDGAKIAYQLKSLLSCLPDKQSEHIKRFWLFSSFNHSSLFPLACAQLPVALIYDKLRPDWLMRAKNLNAQAVHLHWSGLNQEVVHSVIKTGRKIRAFTVNQHTHFQHCQSLGVHGVFTDKIKTHKQLTCEHFENQATLPPHKQASLAADSI